MHTRKQEKQRRRLLAEDSLRTLTREEQCLHAGVLYDMSGHFTAAAFSEYVLNQRDHAGELLSFAESCMVAARATRMSVEGANVI